MRPPLQFLMINVKKWIYDCNWANLWNNQVKKLTFYPCIMGCNINYFYDYEFYNLNQVTWSVTISWVRLNGFFGLGHPVKIGSVANHLLALYEWLYVTDYILPEWHSPNNEWMVMSSFFDWELLKKNWIGRCIHWMRVTMINWRRGMNIAKMWWWEVLILIWDLITTRWNERKVMYNY